MTCRLARLSLTQSRHYTHHYQNIQRSKSHTAFNIPHYENQIKGKIRRLNLLERSSLIQVRTFSDIKYGELKEYIFIQK